MAQVYRPEDYKQRSLKPLKGNYIPSVWLFVDTETTPRVTDQGQVHEFYLGWANLWIRSKKGGPGYSRWKFFISPIAFNRYIESMAERYGFLFLVGHNIFFDLQASGAFDDLTRWGWELEFYYDRGLTYILKCYKGGARLTVLSSTNWFDQSLKSLGEVVGLSKKEVDFDDVDTETLKDYCRRDVEILARAVKYYISFVGDHDLGRLAMTKASQAFTAFRSRFMAEKIYLHDEADVHALERQAYMGGRVECFFIGHCKGGPFVSLDINSMYPYVMSKYRYPTRLVDKTGSRDPVLFLDTLKRFGVIAECEMDTDEPVYAVRHNKKTVFPVGRFTAYLCSRGLALAIQRGHVVKIKSSAIYRMADLFTPYVDYFYPLKLKYQDQGNAIMTLLTKYMLNSLYGKFGQLEIITVDEPSGTPGEYLREEIFNMVTGRTVVVTKLMNHEIVQYSGGEGETSAAAIAAHITEDARLTLWSLIQDVGRSRVLYCDTDSIKVRRRDLSYITWPLDERELGALKIEAESQTLVIGGSKNYRTESGRKIKGIPKNAVETAPGVFKYASFLGQVAHLRQGTIRGAEVREVTRVLKSPYNKGVVHPSGRVTPLEFPVGV